MSSDDLVRAAKNEEQRLLTEIMKTELYRQLEAVRAVIAVYPPMAEQAAVATMQSGPMISPQANGAASERNSKANAVLHKAAEAQGETGMRSRSQ